MKTMIEMSRSHTTGEPESRWQVWQRSLTATLVSVLLLAGSPVMAASESDGARPGADNVSVVDIDRKYSDGDVLKLLLAGQGPVADDNPELLRYLGFAANRPMTDPEILDELVVDFLEYYPEFSEEIRAPLESGDPRQVEHALMDLTTVYEGYYLETYEVRLNTGDYGMAGCGWAVACAYVAVTGLAVANGAAYATVAGVTFVFVAAAAVFIVGPIAYLDDKNGVDSRATALEKDEITLRIAEALAA